MSFPIEDVAAGRVDLGDVLDPREAGQLPPLHPGEILSEEFLEPLGMSAYALAKALRVPLNRITAILAGERAISADTALRLARFLRHDAGVLDQSARLPRSRGGAGCARLRNRHRGCTSRPDIPAPRN